MKVCWNSYLHYHNPRKYGKYLVNYPMIHYYNQILYYMLIHCNNWSYLNMPVKYWIQLVISVMLYLLLMNSVRHRDHNRWWIYLTNRVMLYQWYMLDYVHYPRYVLMKPYCTLFKDWNYRNHWWTNTQIIRK